MYSVAFLYLRLNGLALRSYFFFFSDTPTTEIYTLSLHDALPISDLPGDDHVERAVRPVLRPGVDHLEEHGAAPAGGRSEEHTSELQSHVNLVCRLLLEKKKKKKNQSHRLP